MSERASFTFRYQPPSFSKYEILLNYINEEKEMTKKEFILNSLSSLWMPFAYSSCSNISEKELKQHTLFAIYKLKLHIQLLENTFEINSNNSYKVSPQPIENGDEVSEDNEQDLSVVDETEDNNDDFLEIQDFQDQDVDNIFKLNY